MYNFNNSKFNKIWEKLIAEEKLLVNKNKYPTLKCIGLEEIDPLKCDIINEDIYINVLPKKFKRFIINKFKEMWKNKIGEIEIPICNLINKIDQSEINNYQDFWTFLQELTNNKIGTLKLKFALPTENNYYELPELFRELNVNSKNPEYTVFSFSKYKDWLNYQINVNKSYNEILTQFKQVINQIDDFGTIAITTHAFLNNTAIENVSIKIDHEVRHFFNFLIRLNNTNWNICRQWAKKPHQKFNSNNVQQTFKEYFLDEDEFLNLGLTYIEYLINLFKANEKYFQNINKITEINNLIKSTLYLSGIISIGYTDFWIEKLNTLKSINEITNFFKTQFNDSKYIYKNTDGKIIKGKINKYKTLVGWVFNAFNRAIADGRI